MYLRLTQRRNRDGTVVRYVQLAHNRRVNGRPRAEVVANLGREDQIDVAALRRLVASIGRYLDRVEEAEQPDSGGVAPVRSGRPARRRSTGPGGSKPAAADRLGWAGPPAGLDRFVGRDAALADLPGLLSHHRLVTVSGPNFSGTRF